MKKYVVKTIRVEGNRKTSNAIDVVRGCTGAEKRKNGCYNSCYACRMSKMASKMFQVPVVNEFDENILSKDLEKNKETWIRIGTNGDPSHCWRTTLKVCQIVSDHGKIPVIMTKVWKLPTEDTLKALAKTKAQIQVGISAMDTSAELNKRLDFAKRFKALAGKKRCIIRFATLAWKEGTAENIKQDELFKMIRKDYRIVEGPLRIFSTVPYWDDVDHSKLTSHISPFTGREDSQKTSGLIYAKKFKSYQDDKKCNNDGSYLVCHETSCDKCYHKCGTK
jgi:hypothetical protein